MDRFVPEPYRPTKPSACSQPASAASEAPDATSSSVNAARSAAEIKRELEEALPRTFKLDSDLIAVHVLTRAQLRAVVRKRPKGFGDKPDTYHSDAVFLMGIDARTAMKVFDPRPGVDEVWPGTGVIYAQRLTAALLERGVITDFRAPDSIRIGVSPLTTSFEDVHAGLATLRECLRGS